MRVVAWINADIEKPNDDRRVLVVKELKNGRREIAFGYFAHDHRGYDAVNRCWTDEGAWVTNGCQRVSHWTELPKLPEV